VNKGKFIWQLLEQEETRKATFQGPTKFRLRPRLRAGGLAGSSAIRGALVYRARAG